MALDIEEQYEKIYHYCFYRLHNREQAEDAPAKDRVSVRPLGSWDNIDFEDRRQVADIILSQIHATGERVSFEWKI